MGSFLSPHPYNFIDASVSLTDFAFNYSGVPTDMYVAGSSSTDALPEVTSPSLSYLLTQHTAHMHIRHQTCTSSITTCYHLPLARFNSFPCIRAIHAPPPPSLPLPHVSTCRMKKTC
jgi:hypothetical protein